MSRRGDRSIGSQPYVAVGDVVCIAVTLLAVACQEAGIPRSIIASASASGAPSPTARTSVTSPTMTAVPTLPPIPTAARTPPPPASLALVTGSPSASPTGADAAAATVSAYLDALAAGRYQDAWQIVAPSAGRAWGSETAFASERAAFYASSGPTVVVATPDNSAETLAAWIPPSFDGDRQRSYVIAVDHPRIESNASREVFIAAPDSSGTWHLWIGR